MTVTLFHQDSSTTIHIEAGIDDSGALRVAGHDLGDAPREHFGHDDYEYVASVAPSDKDRLLLALLEGIGLSTLAPGREVKAAGAWCVVRGAWCVVRGACPVAC